MSDLTERIEKHVEKFSSGYDGVVVGVTTSEDIRPGLNGMHEMLSESLADAASVVYHELSGSPQPDTMRELYDQLELHYAPLAIRVASLALVCGMEVSEDNNYQVKWHRLNRCTNKLFEHKSFRHDAELRSMSMLEDEEYRSYLHERIRSGAYSLGHLTGYAQEPDTPEVVRKSWNIWYLAARSVATSLYLAGLAMGAENKEEETLKGILSATEEGETDA